MYKWTFQHVKKNSSNSVIVRKHWKKDNFFSFFLWTKYVPSRNIHTEKDVRSCYVIFWFSQLSTSSFIFFLYQWSHHSINTPAIAADLSLTLRSTISDTVNHWQRHFYSWKRKAPHAPLYSTQKVVGSTINMTQRKGRCGQNVSTVTLDTCKFTSKTKIQVGYSVFSLLDVDVTRCLVSSNCNK